MSDPLSSAWRKVRRARDHVQGADEQLEIIRDAKPWVVAVEIDPETGEKVYRVQGDPQLPETPLPLLIGDALYNFRSALDHVAYQLVLAKGEQPTIQTAFPIIDAETPDAKRLFDRRVKGMSEQAIALIEGMQPYPGRNLILHRGLRALDMLCNIDKHRHFNPVFVNMTGYSAWVADNAPFDDWGAWPERIEDGTVVARLPREEADVNFVPVFDVAFGVPGVGHTVHDTLAVIDVAVSAHVLPSLAALPELSPARL